MTKMLFIDIETAPILGHVWSLWKQNVGLNQIKEDWYIMSFCAKWAGENEIIYEDGRDTPEDDYSMLLTLHKLLDQADYVVAHNGDRFDIKKIKARMILNGISPPSPFKSIDTLKIVKKEFAFTSNKLAYLTDKLCTTKKLDHAKYAGFTLWTECLRGNDDAWEEMREYNIVDVTSSKSFTRFSVLGRLCTRTLTHRAMTKQCFALSVVPITLLNVVSSTLTKVSSSVTTVTPATAGHRLLQQ